VREIQQRTGMLLGRQRELAEIASFASGTSGYLWLAGDMWAGKTSLLASAVTALPEEVDVVSYFLSRREADADSLRFLAAVVPQLAYLLQEDPPLADVHQFRSLWQRATQRANARSRHLLLIVDGLDEDVRPARLPTVAALLPQTIGSRAHVLVSSRLNFQLPWDLPARHPLAQVAPVEVKPFMSAPELAALARQEIDDLLQRDDGGLTADVLGLLTAAVGPLAVEDLAAMTVVAPPSAALNRQIRRLLTVEAARSLQRINLDGDGYYQFAHESLLEHAQVDDDLNDPNFRHRIHQWADSWRTAGWPVAADGGDGTPRYLLDAYPSTLASEPQRLTELVTDIGWIEAAVRSVGIDRVLAELRRAAAANPASKTVATLLAVITSQAYYLRPPKPVNQTGYVLRQLCLQACELSEDYLADEIRGRLQSKPGRRLVPHWTTRRTSLAVSVDLGQSDSWVWALSVLPDARLVTGEGSGRVLVRDPSAPSAPSTELGRHGGVARAMAVLPDGRIVTGGYDHRVLVWELEAPGVPLAELGRHNGDVLAVAVLPDGRVVSGGADGRVLVWDTAAPGTVVAELDQELGQVEAVAVLPDGRVVSGGADGQVLVWDPSAVGLGAVELGRHGAWRAVAVLPDERVVTVGDDGRVLVWRADEPGADPAEIGRRNSRFMVITALPNGQVVTGGDDGRVLVWDPATPGVSPLQLGRHDGWVSALAVLPDNRVVSSGHDYRLFVWEVNRCSAVLSDIIRDDAEVNAVVVLLDGRVATGMAYGGILVWNPAAPKANPIRLDRQNDQVDNMAVLPDGRIVTGGKDGRLLVWDPAAPGTNPVEVGRHDGWIWAVGVLPDGRVVTTVDERPVTGRPYEFQLLVWDLNAPGAAPVELARQESTMVVLTVLPDGRVVTGGGRLLVWDPAAPAAGPVLLDHDAGAMEMALLPDGRVVTGGSDGQVLIRDPASPQTDAVELGRHSRMVWAVATLPNGQVITSGYERLVVVRDMDQEGDAFIEVGSAVTMLATAPLDSETDRIVMAHQGAGFSIWSLTW